jgi:hypothetical protein
MPKNYGLGGTRYGVRLGSMAASDAGNTPSEFALGQVPNWGQGPSPYYDNTSYLITGEGVNLPHWTAIPYLGQSGASAFDIMDSDPGTGTATGVRKMQSPQDIILARAQAVDTSRRHPVSALPGLGQTGAIGTTIGPSDYGLTISSMMVDVEAELMLAGVDRNAYKTTLTSSIAKDGSSQYVYVASPTGQASAALYKNLYSVITQYTPGPWVTAKDMFSNPSIYCYIGVRDNSDTVLGVTAYVNMALSRISYSFAVGSGLTRSFSLVGPKAVDFPKAAIDAWYRLSPRYRLTTPGMQISNARNTNTGTPNTANEYAYSQFNGGEFMAQYGKFDSVAGGQMLFTSAKDALKPGAPMRYVVPGTNTAGGWGFLPPAYKTLLGGVRANGDPVYMPSMAVGRDCFLDLAFYNAQAAAGSPAGPAWQWASALLNADLTTGSGSSVQNMQAYSPDAQHPGGIARVQAFTVAAQSNASLSEEMGNRSMVGVVTERVTVGGTISILETDVADFERVIYQAVQPMISYVGAPAVGSPPTAVPDGTPLMDASSVPLAMYDLSVPIKVNAVMTVASPAANRTAMMRFVLPNIRVSSNSRRVQVNGITARQYAFVCEDGGVASAADQISGGTPIAGRAPQGNLALNPTAPPEGFGIKLGNTGGDTGGLAIQSFLVPNL